MALSAMFAVAQGPGAPRTAQERAKLLKVAAGRNDSVSCARAWLQLGRIHELGDGVAPDLRHALHCYEQASERGEPYGALLAGKLLYKGGPGFNANPARAEAFFVAAANEGGVPEAQRALGELYLMGPDDGFDSALRFFVGSFEADPVTNATAGLCAARMLACGLGNGGAANLAQAGKMTARVAERGRFGPAELRLAVMHELGSGGVAQDPAKARKWAPTQLGSMLGAQAARR